MRRISWVAFAVIASAAVYAFAPLALISDAADDFRTIFAAIAIVAALGAVEWLEAKF